MVGAALVALLLAAGRAEADEPLGVGVGIIGVTGASVLDPPDDQTITVGGLSGRPASLPDDPGFAGLTLGAGLSLEVRAFGWVGLELDVIRSRDRGQADLIVSRREQARQFTLEIGHEAYHFPLLLKALVPTDTVQPVLLFGPEFVAPFDAHAEITEGSVPYAIQYRARSEVYTMLTLGLGLEIKLGLSALDLRIPVSLRGSLTPEVSDARQDRALYVGTDVHRLSTVEYSTIWRYQLLGTAGVATHF